VKDFRQLKVWAKSHVLALDIYKATRRFPVEERFALVDQMRRCAVSVPSNLAEGCGRDSDKDFARFVRIAAGSVSELEYQILLACELGYLTQGVYRQLEDQASEVKKMLNSLTQRLTQES
jgi:four helix bundle protein